MFPSFTGSARRQRQVNLSNRNTNIFAAHTSGRHAPSGLGPQATLAAAQQERLQRQQERDRLQASRVLQRTWRGHKSRRQTRAIWRNEWDMVERKRNPDILAITDSRVETSSVLAYTSAAECMAQLRILLHFIEFNNGHDAVRLAYFAKCFQKTLEEAPSLPAEGEWANIIARFGKSTLRYLSASISSTFPVQLMDDLLQLTIFLPKLVPRQMARYSRQYYSVMAALTLRLKTEQLKGGLIRDSIVRSILALLQPITSETLDAYEWFARIYLTIPSLSAHLDHIDDLAAGVNYKLLASAIDSHILWQSDESILQSKDLDARLSLLAHFIFFYRRALGDGAVNQAPELLFVKVVSNILGPAASVVAQRLDVDRHPDTRSVRGSKALSPFVHDELLTLVNQHSITHLLSQAGPKRSTQVGSFKDDEPATEYAKSLASYALTLLRVFPQRGDEIRMWLYLGSTYTSKEANQSHMRIPAIKYFWSASKLTRVFDTVVHDARAVLPTLLPPDSQPSTAAKSWPGRDQEWTIILIFLELYTFLLKVLDDEEFFSAGTSLEIKDGSSISWTQESSLPLNDVKTLTSFLKNLAFTLCWNAAELAPPETSSESNGLSSYFSTSSTSAETLSNELSLKTKARNLGGVTGIPLDYFKGLVTGLLRMIHERDSRRKFLPDGHWLMTGRLDMEGFIPTVVAEEEKRHNLQDEEDEDGEGSDEVGEDGLTSSGLVGTGQAQQVRRIEFLRKRQHQMARRKELEAIAPRLEILRNMPFFIPFATRVQIFRTFIYRDQLKRRRGMVDPDAWRLSIAQSAIGMDPWELLGRHQADIRRENLFEDAFSEFYQLGDGLKEPIQISFIDQFGTPEAGIDGGGVTKEFLTSIINEAFDPSSELSLFIENDQHLLHPNPAAVEQRRALLRQKGMIEGSRELEAQVRELLKRYEFIGRIIGKCLYEGILVDVNFAGFFLLKWALTGGTSSARKESAYRANLNDLRDLDETLYQGLLQLKNYPGDVEDFALNFTVTDTVTIPGDAANGTKATTQSITKDLKPNGSNIPVTNQNRLVYISYMARHRLQRQPFYQTNAFLQGLGQIIQPSWLSMFNQAELQTLVGGDAGEIDVEDLRRNTLYSGVYVVGDDGQDHPTVALFWEVLRAMSNADKGKVLKFVTSTPRAPLLGFSHLHPRFSIRDSSGDEERLPSASTCANLLKLPRYSSADTLREKLMYAVSSGAGFDLS